MAHGDSSSTRRRAIARIWVAVVSLLALGHPSSAETLTVKWQFDRDNVILESTGEYTQVSLADGLISPRAVGSPALPARYVNVAIPADAEMVDVAVTAGEELIAEDVTVWPVQPSRTTNTPPMPFVPPDKEVYATVLKWPADLGSLEGTQWLHGHKLATISLNPVRYLPGNRELYLATTMEAVLTYRQGNPSTAGVARSQVARASREVSEFVANPKDVEQLAPTAAKAPGLTAPDADSLTADSSAVYLLITSESLASAFQALVDRRTTQGKTGKLVTTEWIYANYDGTRPDGGSDNQTRIRNCIIDHYRNHGTVWVCLAGDDIDDGGHDLVPVRLCYDWGLPVDLYYAGVDDTWDADADGIYGEPGADQADYLPEVWTGRIPVRSSEQAAAYVNKLIRYETRSPDDFANSMLLGSSFTWYMSGLSRPLTFQDHDPVDEGEWPMRKLYREAIQPYWQATPLHELFSTFTSWDSRKCGDYGVTYEHMVAALNRGPQHIWLWGHGWSGGGAGIDRSMARQLTNLDRPSILYATSCSTGSFHWQDESCSEAFLRANGGAVAYIGATASTASADWHARLFYDEVFHNRRPTIGEAFGCAWIREYNSGSLELSLQADPALLFLGPESGRKLQMLSPKGCEEIDSEADMIVRWNAAGSAFAEGEQVRLDYSPDSGEHWLPVTGAQNRPYNGCAFVWENPSLPKGAHYRLRVSSLTDPTVTSQSGDFGIAPTRVLTVLSTPTKSVEIQGTHPNWTDYTYCPFLGAPVSLTATSLAGYDFSGWTDANGQLLTRATTYAFTLAGNKTLTATYVPTVATLRDYYVNDETHENGFSAGNDENDGLTPAAPVRHIQQIIDRYNDIAAIHVSAGTYVENIKLEATDSGIALEGAGAAVTVIDGNQSGSCLQLTGAVNATIRGVTLRNGKAECGGGVSCPNSVLTIERCSVLDNVASADGGGLYAAFAAQVTVKESTFQRNTAGRNGGAICGVNLDSASIVGSAIGTNTASCLGGGLAIQTFAHVTVTGNTFESNRASSNGGAINLWAASNGSVEVTNNICRDNHATVIGGAIVLSGIKVGQFSGNTVANNSADLDGGGAYLANVVSMTVNGNNFTGNHASRWVGGLCLLTCTATVGGNIIKDNTSGDTAAGLHLSSGTTATVIGNTITGNKAGYDGGGIDSWSSTAILVNNLVRANTAQDNGAGICLRGTSQLMIINNTVSKNTAVRWGGGLLVADTSTAQVANTILWSNTASSGAEAYLHSTSVTSIAHSDVRGGINGVFRESSATLNWLAGNIALDPQFAPSSDSLRPLPGSPCIDSGDNSAVPADTLDLDGDVNTTEPVPFDLDGRSRFADEPATPNTGVGTAPIVDIGAYESNTMGDDDGDGVLNSLDQCPHTVPGAWVDTAGCPAMISGDFDRDGDVDRNDFASFQGCLSGPAIPLIAGCENKNLDQDDDVDQADFGIFQRCYSGTNKPADPSCAN